MADIILCVIRQCLVNVLNVLMCIFGFIYIFPLTSNFDFLYYKCIISIDLNRER